MKRFVMDYNATKSNTISILQLVLSTLLDDSNITSEQNITLRDDCCNLLCRSVRLKTIYTDYYIRNNELQKNSN